MYLGLMTGTKNAKRLEVMGAGVVRKNRWENTVECRKEGMRKLWAGSLPERNHSCRNEEGVFEKQ